MSSIEGKPLFLVPQRNIGSLLVPCYIVSVFLGLVLFPFLGFVVPLEGDGLVGCSLWMSGDESWVDQGC